MYMYMYTYTYQYSVHIGSYNTKDKTHRTYCIHTILNFSSAPCQHKLRT